MNSIIVGTLNGVPSEIIVKGETSLYLHPQFLWVDSQVR